MIMKFSSAFCYFPPFRSRYIPQHPVSASIQTYSDDDDDNDNNNNNNNNNNPELDGATKTLQTDIRKLRELSLDQPTSYSE
jgi:hypothetical protein